MADFASIGAGAAITFLASGGVMYEVIAAACSSPQTTEINASSRAETLMKWVHIGIIQGAIFVAAAALIASKTGGSPLAAIAGGLLAAVMMYGCYWHAKSAGLKSNKPGTETY